MNPTKHYCPDSVYIDKAGTYYTITYNTALGLYHMVRLQWNKERICNSGCTFTKWIRELNLVEVGTVI